MISGKRLIRQPARPAAASYNPESPIKIDRTELQRSMESLKVSQMTDEDWARYGPPRPNPNKHKKKGGKVA